MTSIVIYSTEPECPGDPPLAQGQRISGMIEAGVRLKQALSTAAGPNGILSEQEVETAVRGVIDDFAAPGSHFEPVLEHKSGSTTAYYNIAQRATPNAKFELTNRANPTDTRKLNLAGAVDTFESHPSSGKAYKMTVVAPLTVSDAATWDYLYKTIYLDLKAINVDGDNREKTINYLMATYAFTRCR